MDREENLLMNLNEKLKYYINTITKNIKVDKIILFGSFSNGNPHEYSDIDIAVISPELDSNKSQFENIRTIKERADLIDPGLQLLAYPTETFEKELGVERLFIKEIKNTGTVLFDANLKNNGRKAGHESNYLALLNWLGVVDEEKKDWRGSWPTKYP